MKNVFDFDQLLDEDEPVCYNSMSSKELEEIVARRIQTGISSFAFDVLNKYVGSGPQSYVPEIMYHETYATTFAGIAGYDGSTQIRLAEWHMANDTLLFFADSFNSAESVYLGCRAGRTDMVRSINVTLNRVSVEESVLAVMELALRRMEKDPLSAIRHAAAMVVHSGLGFTIMTPNMPVSASIVGITGLIGGLDNCRKQAFSNLMQAMKLLIDACQDVAGKVPPDKYHEYYNELIWIRPYLVKIGNDVGFDQESDIALNNRMSHLYAMIKKIKPLCM